MPSDRNQTSALVKCQNKKGSLAQFPKNLFYFFMMLVKGLEPPLCCQKRILSPPRLPFRHTSIVNHVLMMSI